MIIVIEKSTCAFVHGIQRVAEGLAPARGCTIKGITQWLRSDRMWIWSQTESSFLSFKSWKWMKSVFGRKLWPLQCKWIWSGFRGWVSTLFHLPWCESLGSLFHPGPCLQVRKTPSRPPLCFTADAAVRRLRPLTLSHFRWRLQGCTNTVGLNAEIKGGPHCMRRFFLFRGRSPHRATALLLSTGWNHTVKSHTYWAFSEPFFILPHKYADTRRDCFRIGAFDINTRLESLLRGWEKKQTCWSPVWTTKTILLLKMWRLCCSQVFFFFLPAATSSNFPPRYKILVFFEVPVFIESWPWLVGKVVEIIVAWFTWTRNMSA